MVNMSLEKHCSEVNAQNTMDQNYFEFADRHSGINEQIRRVLVGADLE